MHVVSAWGMHSGIYPGSPLRIAYYGNESRSSLEVSCQQTLMRGFARILPLKERSGQPEFTLADAYQHYVRLYAEQMELDTDDAFKQMFEQLFVACPYLMDIIVSAGDCLVPTTTYRVQDFTRALAWPKSDPESLQSGVHALNSVLCAALKTNKKLHMLGAGRLGYNFFLQNNDTLASFTPAFATLTKLLLQLEMTFELGLRNEDEGDLLVDPLCGSSYQHIPNVLRQMINLQDMTIILPGLREQGKISLSCILGNTESTPHWPQLRRLRLEWCETDAEYLFSFLVRHASTLKFLRLADIDFRASQEWSNAFTKLCGLLANLQELQLRGKLGIYSFPGTESTTYLRRDAALTREVQFFVLRGAVGAVPSAQPFPRKPDIPIELKIDEVEEYLKWWLRS
ncbi:hypothetical protein R3P38DRAFT_1117354 [Favolaschia claudopus]|uniref:Uncharacterized protein n=1 Tax=Favolaschia claudopus TaxID=2862362 RepID=A0AAW0B9E1_9AGAR